MVAHLRKCIPICFSLLVAQALGIFSLFLELKPVLNLTIWIKFHSYGKNIPVGARNLTHIYHDEYQKYIKVVMLIIIDTETKLAEFHKQDVRNHRMYAF